MSRSTETQVLCSLLFVDKSTFVLKDPQGFSPHFTLVRPEIVGVSRLTIRRSMGEHIYKSLTLDRQNKDLSSKLLCWIVFPLSRRCIFAKFN
jgi:hypothetical protein